MKLKKKRFDTIKKKVSPDKCAVATDLPQLLGHYLTTPSIRSAIRPIEIDGKRYIGLAVYHDAVDLEKSHRHKNVTTVMLGDPSIGCYAQSRYGLLPLVIYLGGDDNGNLKKYVSRTIAAEHRIEDFFIDPDTGESLGVIFVHPSDMKGVASILGSSGFGADYCYPWSDVEKKVLLSSDEGETPFYRIHPIGKCSNGCEQRTNHANDVLGEDADSDQFCGTCLKYPQRINFAVLV